MERADSPPVAPEEAYVDSGPGGPPDFVVLDIGDDVGALIVYASENCNGIELDLTAAGAERTHHTHTMIRRRRLLHNDVFAGVYPELTEGTYTIWGRSRSLGDVVIVGGEVTEFDAGDCP